MNVCLRNMPCLFCLTYLLATPIISSASTVVVFSNFGSGFSSDTNNGNVIGLGGFAQADTFKPDFTAAFESLEISLSCAFTCPDNFTVSLTASSSGRPGTVIESFIYPGVGLGALGDTNTPLSFTSVLHPMLIARAQYWIEVQAPSGSADAIAWNWNPTGDPSPEALSSNSGSSWFVPSGQTPGAYQVDATIPEPGSISLLLAGGALLACLRKKARAQGRDAIRWATRMGALITLVLSASLCAVGATWTPLMNFAPGGAGVMIQLTDGTVMIQNGSSAAWMRLTPDSNGSYIRGTWVTNPISPMKLDRLYFTAQVLPSGKVWVLGGEYSGPFLDPNITPDAEIWDPITNTWSSAAPYPTEAGDTHCGTQTVSSNVSETSSDVLSAIYSTRRFQVGWRVSGFGIPPNTTVTSVDSETQVHISNAATATLITRLTFTGQALACFGDDPSMLLPNGDILAGNISNNTVAMYSVATDSWSLVAGKHYQDPSDEEGWIKLSSGKILAYDVFQTISAANGNGYAELYDPVSQIWSAISPVDNTASGSLPALSSAALGFELGPGLRLQDGRVFQIGANQHTALYTESTNTWAPGPNISGTLSNNQGQIEAPFGADDAPAAVLPNGHVVLAADAGPAAVVITGDVTTGSNIIGNISSTAGLQVGWNVTTSNSLIIASGFVTSIDSANQIHVSQSATATARGIRLMIGGLFSPPTQLFDFDPYANTISPLLPAIPDLSLNTRRSFVTRMLVLPTGQLLFSDSSPQLYIYTPDDDIMPAMRPVVNNVVYNGNGGFALTGQQLNGQSAGSTYGDDIQNDENYPIVRLTNSTGNVFYCRTTDWSSTGVGPSATPETVNFQLPRSITAGNYTLVVSGAGISSFPTFLHVTAAQAAGQ